MAGKNYTSIVDKLKSTRDSITVRRVFEGALDILTLVLSLIFILWLTTLIFWPAPSFRVALIIIGLAALVALMFIGIVKPVIRKLPLTRIALRLETAFGKLQSRLIASLQLYDKLEHNDENYSIELIEKTIDEAGEEIKDLDFSVAVRKRTTPYKRLAFAAAILAIAFGVSSSTFTDIKNLYANPMLDMPRPNNLTLELTPLYSEVVKNHDITVKIKATGERVRVVDFSYSIDDDKWVSVPAEKFEDDTGRHDSLYTFTFHKVKRDIKYFASAQKIDSDHGMIKVIDPPSIIDVKVSVDFPDYTGLEDQVLPDNDGSVTAIKGSRIHVEADINKPVVTASMVFDDSTTRAMQVKGDKIEGRFVVAKSGSYHIEVTDSSSLPNYNPIEYDIVSLEDYDPQIKLTYPAIDIDLDETMTVPLEAVLFDDFGFSKLELVYWTMSEGTESKKTRLNVKADFGSATQALYVHDWFLEKLYMLPGDLVYYYLEVFDNDAISGPKSAVSNTFSARLPGIDEIMADITGDQNEIFRELQETVDTQKELSEDLDQLARDLKKIEEMDWEKKQEIDNTLDRQLDVSNKLEDISQRMKESIEKFQKNELATMEMLDKMEEIRELLDEVATPELKEAMRQLEEAMKQLDPEMIKKAMENFQFSVEQMNENLDRMLSLLQRIQLEQKMDTLAKLAEKLAADQQKINENIDNADNSDQVADQQKAQEQVKAGLDQMKKLFDEANQMNEELDMLPKEAMEEAKQQLESPALSEEMQKMLEEMMKGNKGQCSSSGQKMQQDMEQMSQMFQQMLQMMQSSELAEIENKLKKALRDVLYLSYNQESLTDSTSACLRRQENSGELTNDQIDLQTATGRLADRMSELTKESPMIDPAIMEQLGVALQNMDNAATELTGRYPNRSQDLQISAMEALNNVSGMILSSLEQVNQCKSSSGGACMNSLMKKLGQMGKQQSALNNQSMPFPMPMMSSQQRNQMQQLAEQQGQLSNEMQALMNEAEETGNYGAMDRIQQLADEMKKVADDMKRFNYTRETRNRQERILSRLLDMQKSVHRRDYTNKRKAKTIDDFIRQGPGDLIFDELGSENLAEDIKRALAEKYPRRYESLIKEYFKSLAGESADE